MEQIDRLKGQSSVYTINRRLVTRFIVIVNVSTLFIESARQTEAYSIGSHQSQASSDSLPTASLVTTSAAAVAQLRPAHKLHSLGNVDGGYLDTVDGNGGKDPQAGGDLKLANNLETNALIYLQRYGYMQAHSNTGANNLISEDSFSNAISSFQKFAGIPETGMVDKETWLYMQMPRCGNKDKTTQPGDSSRPHNQVTKLKFSSHLGSVRRRKRYALQGSKWRRQELTYRISQYPTRFNGKRHEVDSQIEKAFGIWSHVAPIDFVVKKEGRVHIDIRFASGDHGDGDAFDGPGNTLAHAYFPQYGGDAHFDDQEYWTIDSYAGTNIFQVAAHELGHSLGLGHSNVREALMAPFYQKYKPNFKLHVDDILAIQALYGEKPFLLDLPQTVPVTSPTSPLPHSTSTTLAPTTSTTTTSTTSAPTISFASNLPPVTTSRTHQPPTTHFVNNNNNNKNNGRDKPAFQPKHRPPIDDGRETNDDENGLPELPGNSIGPNVSNEDGPSFTGGNNYPTTRSYPADLCSEPTIDAITRTEDGSSYVFKGDFYWLLTNEGLSKGYPRRIATDWEGLPGSLDAALTWADGKTFFFKGNKYWRYKNKRRDLGYPKLISTGFAGIPDDIDAAFVWSGNGRTYIFKGADYWRFDSKADPPVGNEYPRSIKVWNGVPAHVNAAFRWENNVTYFFKGSQYYRFNDKEFKVEARGRPQFPRPSAEWWFGCVSSNLAQRALPTGSKEGLSTQISGVVSESQDIDWSFYAGLKNSTRIMGTHISDHKPSGSPTLSGIPAAYNDSSRRNEPLDYDQITNLHDNPRNGPYNSTPVARTASSSAIPSLQSNCILTLSTMIFILVLASIGT